MAEDKDSVDIENHAGTDSPGRIQGRVSTVSSLSCKTLTTNVEIHSNPLNSSHLEINALANEVNNELSIQLSEISCSNQLTKDGANKTPSDVATADENYTVRQRNSPVASPVITTSNNDAVILNDVAIKLQSSKPEKRKRCSPQTRNVREKLLQYAYKNKSTKNVSFVLQANDEQTTNVEMMDLQTAGTSNSSGAKPASPNNPATHLTRNSQPYNHVPGRQE